MLPSEKTNKNRLKLNGRMELLTYADDVDFLCESKAHTEQNCHILIKACKQTSLEVNIRQVEEHVIRVKRYSL